MTRRRSKIFLLVAICLIALVPFTIVLGNPYAVYSNPPPVGTRYVGGKTYYVLPDGEEGKSYSVTFSTDFPDDHKPYTQWKIDGSIPSGMGTSPSSMKGPTITLSGTPWNAQPGTTITYYFTVEARDNYLDGLGTISKNYMLTIRGSTTPPPPPQKIDYTLDVIGLPVMIDLTPLALGQGTVSKTGYEIRLRKVSGSSEMISLEQSGLPEGVTIWVEGTGIKAPTSLIRENIWLEDTVTLSLGFSVSATDNWRSLTRPSATTIYRILLKARSQSGVEKSVAIGLSIYYNIPKLQIISLKPLTQHGSTLIVKKQTIFKLEYKLDYNSPMDVEYKLDLGNVVGGGWMDPSAESAIVGVEYWHYAGLRKEGDPPHWVYYGRATLKPTSASETGAVYLMEEASQGSGFLPRPSSSGDVHVQVDFDPYKKVTWDEGSITNISETFRVEIYPREYDYARRIKVVLWEEDRRFTPDQFSEYLSKIATPAYMISTPWGKVSVYSYNIYLSGIFKDYYGIYPVTDRYLRGDIGWWDADTVAEEAAEEGFGRVIAIVPNGDLDEGIGVVYNANYYFWDQGFHVAFVDYSEAVNNTNTKNLYFPVIAHELSHTFRFPDIYDSYDIVVPEECVYFDEYQGGIIKVFKYHGTPYFSASVGIRYWDPARNRWVEMPNPGDVIARDIMDYQKDDKDVYWAWASWKRVAGLSGDDPTEGLLISMVIFRNGTVLERPFQRLYNYSWTYLEPEGTGNFSLTFYLKDGTIFKRYPYNMSFYYFVEPVGYKPTDAIPFVRIVPWSDNLGKIELTGPDGKVWFSRIVSAHAPDLEIVYPPDGKKLGIGRNYTLAWKGTDADGDKLWYTVLIRKKGDEVWTCIANRITEDRIALNSPEIKLGRSNSSFSGLFLDEGDYEIQVKATDGINTAVKVIHASVVKSEQIRTYVLKVDSNVGLKIEGSGTYEEGDLVRVKAPAEASVEGFLGLLGGKYLFDHWTGIVESKNTEVVVPMKGDQAYLMLTAIYEEDLTQAYMILGAVAVVVLAVVISVALKLRKRKPALPPPPP